MVHGSRTLRVVLFALAGALAACGGKSSSSSTPTPTPTPGGDEPPAAGIDHDRVKATLAETSVPEACSGTDATTLGELLSLQQQLLGGEADTDVSFDCQPGSEDGRWACTWSVFNKPSGAVDPEDPCAGEGTSGYQIMVEVDADGAIVPDTIFCNAPG